jgi:putative NADH-flavin reductase
VSNRATVPLFGLLVTLLMSWSAAAQTLDILVYGATGEIGSLAVAEALARGHRVTAVSRDPARIETQHERLVKARGDLLDEASIAELAVGQDVILVAVRGVIGDSGSAESALQYIAVEKIVTALRAMADPPRLIHVGGAGSLQVKNGALYADRLPKLFLPRSLEIEIAGQVLALDYLRGVDDVDWTYVTPPRRFTNGERTGDYRLGGDTMLKDGRGRSRISRADFAVALVDEAERAAHLRQRISVAY